MLTLAARGLHDREIAAALVIAQSTVKVHIAHILHKLDVPNRTAAASWLSGRHTNQRKEPTTMITPEIRDELLKAAHEHSIERWWTYQAETGCPDDHYNAFRAGYQNAVIDVLGGIFGRDNVVP